VFSTYGVVTTETLETVTKRKPEPTAEQVAAEDPVRGAREQGFSLAGPDGLSRQLTEVVIETALDRGMTEHLGHERNTPYETRQRAQRPPVEDGADRGHRPDRDRGPAELGRDVRVAGREEAAEISAHFAEIYGASVSKETVSRITDRKVKQMQSWAARPLGHAHAAVLIDAIVGRSYFRLVAGIGSRPTRSMSRLIS